VFPAGIFVAHEKNIFEHANRVYPIYFEYPYQEMDDVTIELPAGWKVSGVPAAQAQDIHATAYNLKVENSSGTVHVVRNLSFDFMLIDKKDYPALRGFFQSVRNSDDGQVLVQPAPDSASN
jgi:hypothetical protein